MPYVEPLRDDVNKYDSVMSLRAKNADEITPFEDDIVMPAVFNLS